MARPSPPSTLSIVAALGLAVGLGIWSAERAIDVLGLRPAPAGARGPDLRGATPPGASARVAGRPSSPAPAFPSGIAEAELGAAPAPTLPSRIAEGELGAAAVAAASSAPEADDAGSRTEAERAAADRLMGAMGRLVRDLEYNADAGLAEPPQQVVAAAPEPWRPVAPAPSAATPVIEAIEPRSAAASGGARVTIRGRNLRPVQVMFGSEAARIVSASDRAITVVAPGSRAGSVPIAVTNDDGAFALAAVPFRYDASR